jgi:hypothetical protein
MKLKRKKKKLSCNNAAEYQTELFDARIDKFMENLFEVISQ